MIYQLEDKLKVMVYYGLSFEEVNLPFAEWMVLRGRYFQEIKEKSN